MNAGLQIDRRNGGGGWVNATHGHGVRAILNSIANRSPWIFE
jgi:hypothetical protein